MAVGDVYSLQVQMEGFDSPGSVNFHYQEVTPSDSGDRETFALARAWNDSQLLTDMLGLLANPDVAVTGVYVLKRSGTPVEPGYFTDRRPGGNSGPALPFNNGLRVNLGQSFFPANRNGLVWIPGVRELDCNGNQFTAAFMAGSVATFVASLLNLIEETPNLGQWRLGVLSRKHLVDNPGDFAGAFADVTSASASPIVGSQRRRTTKRRGAPGAVV